MMVVEQLTYFDVPHGGAMQQTAVHFADCYNYEDINDKQLLWQDFGKHFQIFGVFLVYLMVFLGMHI